MLPGIKKLQRKWQGRWAILALIKTPTGEALEFETDLPEDVAKKLIETVTALINQRGFEVL